MTNPSQTAKAIVERIKKQTTMSYEIMEDVIAQHLSQVSIEGETISQTTADEKLKAAKWDALNERISKFYDDESEGDLCDIGEVAAAAFGYLG